MIDEEREPPRENNHLSPVPKPRLSFKEQAFALEELGLETRETINPGQEECDRILGPLSKWFNVKRENLYSGAESLLDFPTTLEGVGRLLASKEEATSLLPASCWRSVEVAEEPLLLFTRDQAQLIKIERAAVSLLELAERALDPFTPFCCID